MKNQTEHSGFSVYVPHDYNFFELFQVEKPISINISDIAVDDKFWENEKSGVAICILNSAIPEEFKLPCVHAKLETFVSQALNVVGFPLGKGFEITKITYDSLNVKSNEICQKDQNVTEKMICLHQPEMDCFFGRGSEFIFLIIILFVDSYPAIGFFTILIIDR